MTTRSKGTSNMLFVRPQRMIPISCSDQENIGPALHSIQLQTVHIPETFRCGAKGFEIALSLNHSTINLIDSITFPNR